MSQCISGWSDHCLVSHESVPGGEQSVCCNADGPGPHFSDLYEFVPTDTSRHQCCFITVRNTTGRACGGLMELNDGLSCGYGCRMCDDLLLDRMVDYLDGDRWLRAEQRIAQRYWDARGLIHDLRSNEYHPIPGAIVYERGSCWENGGRECFQEDACTCFGANVPEYPGFASSAGTDPDDDLNCAFAHVPGDPIDGRLFPDPFFRTGYRWPPGTMAGALGSNYQGMERLYCRKFQDTRLPFETGGGHGFTRVLISPTKSGGLSGVTEPMLDPVLMSSNVCNSDRMVACTARMGTNSPCVGHSAWDELLATNPDADPRLSFYNHDEPSRNRFNYLSINADNTAHIRGPEDREGLGGPTVKWKNTVLDAIKTGSFEFRESEDRLVSLAFDRLDYMHPLQKGGNALVGIYRREWDAMGEFAVEVPGGSGTGQLRMRGCVFDYKTVLTHVKIECRLILPQVKEWFETYRIEPISRFHIIGLVMMQAFNLRHEGIDGEPSEACQFTPYDGDQKFLLEFCEITELEQWPHVCSVEIPTEEPPLPLPPPVPLEEPESLMFFDSEGKQFIPDRVVEWRGMLGGHSRPSAEDQRITLMPGGASCGLVVDRFNYHPDHGEGIVVPGWPTHADSLPDDPQQVYGGHVRLEFP